MNMDMDEGSTYLKSVAIFMIYLTLSITLFSVMARPAEAIFSGSVHGQDRIQGYRRINDSTTVSILTDYDFASLLSASGGDGLPLSCGPSGEGVGYVCTYTFDTETQNPQSYTLRVKPGDESTQTITYAVDGEPPSFSDVAFSSRPGGLQASYSVRDTSFPGGSGCAGMRFVRVIANDDVVGEYVYNESTCSDQGLIEAELPGIEGYVDLSLHGVDRLGNGVVTEEESVEIDTIEPALPGGFRLSRGEHELTKISNNSMTDIIVNLNFTITETNLRTVRVDASELNPSMGYTGLNPRCVADGSRNKCSLENLILRPAPVETGNASSGATVQRLKIGITAVDAAGNRKDGEAYTTLDIVNTRPEITYIGRADKACDDCFIRRGTNRFRITVNAPGGLYANALGLRLEGTMLPPPNCTQANGDVWNCFVTGTVSRSGGTATLQVLPTSMDDLGNQVTGITSKGFTVDSVSPRVLDQPKLDVSCPTAGQQLHISLTARDALSTELYIGANVSSITDRTWAESVCESNDGINGTPEDSFNCILAIDSFVSVYTEADIPIVIEDEAGNNVTLEMRNFEVCEANTEVSPNFITRLSPSITPLPSVDKRIASLTRYRVLIPLAIQTLDTTPRGRPIQVRRTSCDGQFTPGPSYVMNEFSDYPMLVTHFKYEGVWPNGTVPLNCTLDFTIRRGNTVYIQPETEYLNLELPTSRVEMGMPGEAVVEKRAKLVKEANDLQDEIESKAGLDNTMNTICTLAKMLNQITVVLALIRTVLSVICLIYWAIGGTGKALWQGFNPPTGTLHKNIHTYIWPIGWYPTSLGNPGAIIGYLIKWICAIYTCMLYDPSTWSEIGMQGFSDIMAASDNPNFQDPTSTQTGHTDATRVIATEDSSGSVTTVSFDGGQTITGVKGDSSTITPSSGSGLYSKAGGGSIRYLDTNKEGFDYSITARDRDLGAFYRSMAAEGAYGDDWVINPFRSTKYDALCMPAQLYGLRKEKQLKCIEIKCIDELAQSGMPITVCEQKYAVQHCLYVEGAQSRLHSSFRDIIINMFTAVALQLLSGIAMQFLMRSVCKPLFDAYDKAAQTSPRVTCSEKLDVSGIQSDWAKENCVLWSAVCTLMVGFMAVKELGDIMDGGLRTDNPSVPEGTDYCADVDDVGADESGEDAF